jgi:hypothetical protein
MDTYPVIADGPTDFAVVVSHRDGVIHTTGGFYSRLDANAWVADRMVVARFEADERAKLMCVALASAPCRAPNQ